MLRKVLVSTIALSLIAGSIAVVQAADNNNVSAGMKGGAGASFVMMSRLDENEDGTVTLDEFGGERIEVLRNADADGDGALSRDELASYLANRAFQRRAERAAARLDIDGDGTVTITEIEDHQGKRFALMDRNDDGELSQDEMRRSTFATRMRHMDGEHRGGRRFVERRGKGPHHKFKHRTAPATQAAPDNSPADE